MTLTDKVIDLISENHDKNKGAVGLTIVGISASLNIPYSELKIILNTLHKEGKIIVRESINHKLIYKKIDS